MKRDYWSKPFRKLVTLGESHTAGISATRRERGWAAVLKTLIDEFQERPVAFVNQGLGADILSPACPMYAEYRSWRPIGLERYRKHVIAERPDLVIVSYGYNDMRGGTPVAAFARDLHAMVTDLKHRLPGVIGTARHLLPAGRGLRPHDRGNGSRQFLEPRITRSPAALQSGDQAHRRCVRRAVCRNLRRPGRGGVDDLHAFRPGRHPCERSRTPPDRPQGVRSPRPKLQRPRPQGAEGSPAHGQEPLAVRPLAAGRRDAVGGQAHPRLSSRHPAATRRPAEAAFRTDDVTSAPIPDPRPRRILHL